MQASRAVLSPYQGLIPYSEEDAPFFFGRDADRQIIAANLYAARLTILYGASGVGKTSVLQAGVAYYLHQQPGRAIVVFNNWKTDPVAELKQMVAKEIEQVLGKQIPVQADLPLDEFLKQCERGLSGPLVIVLDQFEEYFLYHPLDDGPLSFEVGFARAVNDLDRQVSFLISIREDSLSKLDRFERRIPGLFDNYLRLEHLDRHSASEAITEPLKVYNRELPPERRIEHQPGLVEEVIEQVKIGQVLIGQVGRGQVPFSNGRANVDGVRVEAPYLQMVLLRLWDEEIRRGSRVLRLATLASLGGAERIVHTHLDAAMGNLGRYDQEVSARIFQYLVTPSGTKIALIADDLAGFTEIPVGRVRAVVSRLAAPDLRILRPVASSVVDTADPRYEIYHDVLAPAVLDWRARFLGRSTISRRLAALIAVSVVISATAIQFVALPWPFISTLLRAIPLVVVNIAVLLQVYKWFSRYVRLTSGAFFATAYTEIGLVVPLGMLLTIYWYLSTQWDDVNALGAMETFNFIVYQFITAIFTLFFGSLTFLAMRSIGYLTNRFLKRFDLGFYGTYFVVCVLIAILIILQLLRPSPWIRIV